MDLFPDKVGNVKHAAMDLMQGATPRNVPSTSMSLEDRISRRRENILERLRKHGGIISRQGTETIEREDFDQELS